MSHGDLLCQTTPRTEIRPPVQSHIDKATDNRPIINTLLEVLSAETKIYCFKDPKRISRMKYLYLIKQNNIN